ncbi:Galactose oxidase, central domain containing protein, putative [Trypanosoma equiperdum]|uniref:Uncharacterized protein n=2 Tax=Trypanozoon TaxID=39700 RepID=Q38AA8_TRYB2|nr:hypothetical protein, conserved [Trypanosoma brucei brucei TREU927]EAN78262.1 hypothetical protein, conserved [Trypanosoma brucei brucei TREU927]SCU71329.1 Galactose oxidase, central domain containing protein, putative [Trypanosoma equiperdum]
MSTEVVHRKLNKYEWVEAAPGKGASPRQNGMIKELLGSAAACTEKKFYLCGGFDLKARRSVSQVVEMDVATKQWSCGVPLPERVRDAAAVAFGDCCLVFGGWNDETYTDNLWFFAPKPSDPAVTPPPGSKEPVSCAWSLIPPVGAAPSARTSHNMVLGMLSGSDDAAPTSVVYLFGGFDGAKRLNDVWRLRIGPLMEKNEAEWEIVETKVGVPPVPRDAAAVAFDAAGERLIVFGGFASFLQNDLYIFTLRGGVNTWTSQACLSVPTRRQGCVAAVSGGYFVVCLGGDERGPLPQVLQLSLADFRWAQLSLEREDLSGRGGAVGCVSEKGRRIMLFGGGIPPKLNTSLLELELEKPDAGGSRKKGG